MRVALLADIHGNSIALDAVLADIESKGPVDAYWLLGDYAAIGPDPVGCLERLSELPNASFIYGNTDRYMKESLALEPNFDEAREDFQRLERIASVHITFAWTQGAVIAAGWLDWLAALPLEQRVTLPDGTRYLGVHASPGSDDSWGLHPKQSAEALHELFGGADADLICVGHTHVVMDVEVEGARVVNLGSVSNPFPPDLRASYVLLEADERGYQLEHHFVDYDREAVIAQVEGVRHPAAEYIKGFMRGENKAGWMR